MPASGAFHRIIFSAICIAASLHDVCGFGALPQVVLQSRWLSGGRFASSIGMGGGKCAGLRGIRVHNNEALSMAGAKIGDKVTVNYVGTLADGSEFDSSRKPGRKPFTFSLGMQEVVPGFERACLGMVAGETKVSSFPPEDGYGKPSDDLVITLQPGICMQHPRMSTYI